MTEKLRVLFVDDDPAVRATWRYLYGDIFAAAFAEDGEAALRRMAETPFDVMVVDHRLPGMSGAELCRKAQELAPEVPRVMVTAFGDIDARLCSCKARLEKPVDGDTLESVIREVAAGRRETDEELRAREEEAERAVEEARREFQEALEVA